MQSISPVFTDAEVPIERKIAEHQDEYLTVIGLPVSLQIVDKETQTIKILDKWGTAIRFRLSDEERALIASGHDLVVTQLNFGQPITPLNIQICADRERPVFGEQVDLPTLEEIRRNIEAQQPALNNVVEMPSRVDQADGAENESAD